MASENTENNYVEFKLEGITTAIEWQHPTGDGWRVHLSIKNPGKRTRNLRGNVLMAFKRSPRVNEEVVCGVIMPSLWQETFSYRGDIQEKVINEFAGQLSDEKVEFYIGQSQENKKRMRVTCGRYKKSAPKKSPTQNPRQHADVLKCYLQATIFDR